MFLELTENLLSILAIEYFKGDALVIWGQHEECIGLLLPKAHIVPVNDCAGRCIFTDVNIAQLMTAVLWLCTEASSVLKDCEQNRRLDAALSEGAPDFLGVVMVILSHHNQKNDATFILNPLVATSVPEEETWMNIQAMSGAVDATLKRLQGLRQIVASVN